MTLVGAGATGGALAGTGGFTMLRSEAERARSAELEGRNGFVGPGKMGALRLRRVSGHQTMALAASTPSGKPESFISIDHTPVAVCDAFAKSHFGRVRGQKARLEASGTLARTLHLQRRPS